MVNQMRKRFMVEVLNKDGLGATVDPVKPRYTHVLILGGINDITSDETALRTNDKIEVDLSAMYRMAREAGMKVIAVTLPPWGGFKSWYNPRRGESTRRLNAWIQARLESGEVDHVFDVYPLLSCGDPEKLCEGYGWPDQVHWSKEGHRVVGEALHEQLFSDCE
jgi:lysophospholipase L1-like esterase